VPAKSSFLDGVFFLPVDFPHLPVTEQHPNQHNEQQVVHKWHFPSKWSPTHSLITRIYPQVAGTRPYHDSPGTGKSRNNLV